MSGRAQADGRTAARVAKTMATRRRASRRGLGLVLLAILICVGAVAALRSPLLEVTTITVRGTEYLSAQEVVIAAGLFSGQNILQIRPAEVTSKVLALARVAAAEVTLIWPRAVDVLIEERTGLLVVACGSAWLEVADDGVAIEIHETSEDVPAHLFELSGFVPYDVALGARLPGAEGLAAALARFVASGEAIDAAAFTEQGLEVALADRTMVYLGKAGSDLAERASVALGILGHLRQQGRRIEYIDVRVPGQPVIKPR